MMFALRSMFAAGLLGAVTAVSAQPTLTLQGGVSLTWPTTTNDTYQVQGSAPGSGNWAALGPITNGNGSTNSFYDAVSFGARDYRVLEIVPGQPAAPTLPANGGFESGSGGTAANWSVTLAAGGPVYGMVSNDNPHTGASDFQVHLASQGAGPVVEFSQANIPVVGGTAYPFVFYANALNGSSGYNVQWRILWNAGGDTGYVGYAPGNNAYLAVSNLVVAPAAATSATIFFHFAGAASVSQSATIDLDDVALGAGGGAGTPAQTNIVTAASQPVVNLAWPSALGTLYLLESSTNLAGGLWASNTAVMTGNGGAMTCTFPAGNNSVFYRLYLPPLVIQPPSNVQSVVSGTTNAVGLAWTASPTPGVTGYQVLYGLSANTLSNSVAVGNVNSTVIPDLTPDQTYYFEIIALTAGGQSQASTPVVSAQPDTTVGVVPLFDASTPLEPDTISNTPTALITWLADRPRARHARESQFQLYDTYLPFYWEQRMTTIQIIDTIGKGGTGITFNFSTLNGLVPPNIRTFFIGVTTVAQYSDNIIADAVDATGTNWTSTVTVNTMFNRPLQTGDRMEFEFSPFMATVTNGQLNYYGGAILYVVGQGIVPWQEGATNDPASVNAAIDSVPMPTNGWLAGGNTMPYQYSDEPQNVFNQMTPNASPPTGEPFMLGRRLHHTDFGDGTHSEPGNSVYTQQIGKLGPKFTNRSCIACHVGNGRALPPAIGAPMLQSVVLVGSDAHGTPDPLLGSVLQPQNTSGSPEDTVVISGYTTNNGTYGDGTPYTLVKPIYTFGNYQPAFYSVRLAPQLVGLGLLEAVPETAIEALADPGDANHDGIAGTVRMVTDPETGEPRLGRFTAKGARARVRHQIAAALNSDMGVTTSVYPRLDGETNSGPVELGDTDLTNWTRYVSALGVNARRNLTDPQCLQGEQLFAAANCVQCHVPTLQTSAYEPMAELRNQTIHPYTDLLLHDMGPGLADNMGEGNASGSQWRTSPLWSIGLTAGVSGGEAYLHDGRARSLEEAILWHDGEAAASREVFRTMSASDRAALIAFLKSL